jgi:uncharacterized YccA/Bax inhibitor family protein
MGPSHLPLGETVSGGAGGAATITTTTLKPIPIVPEPLNLVLDFDLIESGARAGAPKYMEWYGGFALMVTLIWLYFEILRLLTKLRSRDSGQ